MAYTAVGIFQGEPEWNVAVKVSGFLSSSAAENYANGFHIELRDGRLYRDIDTSAGGKQWIEVIDEDVALSRLDEGVREKTNSALGHYQKLGMDQTAVASLSLHEFAENGDSPLVQSDDDYVPVTMPIALWSDEEGLRRGFESLAYRIEA